MATLLLLLVLTVFLVALGRRAVPRHERLPWWAWSSRDLAADLVRGGRALVTLHRRQRWLWDAYLDDLQPWRRKAGDGAPEQGDDDRR